MFCGQENADAEQPERSGGDFPEHLPDGGIPLGHPAKRERHRRTHDEDEPAKHAEVTTID